MHEITLGERAALVALLRLRPGGASWPELTTLLRNEGSAQRALTAALGDQLFLSPEQHLALEQARDDVSRWDAADLRFVTVLDADYPRRVRDIHQAPPFLFARGEVVLEDLGVSVVGSRKASPTGLKMAAAISRALVAMDLTVISGLAEGVDVTAHRAALDARGRTVAVIGTGVDRSYPASNASVQAEIERRGLVLSQFWPGAPPQKHTFLMRNATMSGYGIATVVVEAGEHSGARAQARMAVEHGRPVLLTDLVVANTTWARELVDRPGVHVVGSTSDVVETIGRLRVTDDEVARALDDLVRA